ITSATARTAPNTSLSAGPPRPPERPFTSVAPSTVAIMFTSTQGRSADGGVRSSAPYRATGSTSSPECGYSSRIGGSMAPMSVMSGDLRTAYRTCPLCEAGCGLEITLRGDDVVRIRGDRDDVFSHGYICPKGSTLKQLHEDPDRIRTPLIK